MRLKISLSILLFTATCHASVSADPVKLEKLGKVKFRYANEMSGIVKSRRYPNVYWIHNDSGDKARLFAIDQNLKILFPSYLRGQFTSDSSSETEKGSKKAKKKAKKKSLWPGLEVLNAANIDWEDITADDENLYLGDIGNNGNARRDLGIYVLSEPNPRAVDRARVLKFWPIRFPDQKQFPARVFNFDCESMFIVSGKLYFITKHRRGQTQQLTYGGKLYRLDNPKSDEVNTLTYISEIKGLPCATSAELSPDGKKLAVLTLLGVWVFDKPAKGDDWFSGTVTKFNFDLEQSKQIEGICFQDNDNLILNNEQRDVFRLKISSVDSAKKRKKKKAKKQQEKKLY